MSNKSERWKRNEKNHYTDLRYTVYAYLRILRDVFFIVQNTFRNTMKESKKGDFEGYVDNRVFFFSRITKKRNDLLNYVPPRTKLAFPPFSFHSIFLTSRCGLLYLWLIVSSSLHNAYSITYYDDIRILEKLD